MMSDDDSNAFAFLLHGIGCLKLLQNILLILPVDLHGAKVRQKQPNVLKKTTNGTGVYGAFYPILGCNNW